MELTIGDPVQVWDDDGGCWRFGEVTALDDNEVEVTVLNGDSASRRRFASSPAPPLAGRDDSRTARPGVHPAGALPRPLAPGSGQLATLRMSAAVANHPHVVDG